MMDKKSLAALRGELEAVVVDYWYDVDTNGGRNVGAFCAPDCVLVIGGEDRHGPEAVAGYYQKRRERGPRVSCHVVQNFRIEPESDDRVRCYCICTLFAADGVPVLPSRPANTIFRSNELLVRQADGNWLIQERRMTQIFSQAAPVADR